ncbi:hypothetical protein Godav_019735 [Gossypium davidsonii]|uniref:HAT C-terminal dimerisation domain-containing protein n=1 Tax=Gossypium davidsonii TaxID=34287 RepID=A0A7J8R116_GOSDV|nr:hypothetical protein [Gossypium davidsonii]
MDRGIGKIKIPLISHPGLLGANHDMQSSKPYREDTLMFEHQGSIEQHRNDGQQALWSDTATTKHEVTLRKSANQHTSREFAKGNDKNGQGNVLNPKVLGVIVCERWNSTYLMLESALTIKMCNFKLLFDKYVKDFKSTSSSLVGSSNVSNNGPIDSNLHQSNSNKAYLGGDYDESDDYKRYLSESSINSEKAQLDLYLKEPKLKLNSKIDVLDYWRENLIQYHELSLLARTLLAIPILTVATESTFSMGKKSYHTFKEFT